MDTNLNRLAILLETATKSARTNRNPSMRLVEQVAYALLVEERQLLRQRNYSMAYDCLTVYRLLKEHGTIRAAYDVLNKYREREGEIPTITPASNTGVTKSSLPMEYFTMKKDDTK